MLDDVITNYLENDLFFYMLISETKPYDTAKANFALKTVSERCRSLNTAPEALVMAT